MSTEGIFIAAQEGTEWPLTLNEFSDHLCKRWPDVRLLTHHSPVTNKDYLSFQVRRPHSIYADHFPLYGCYFVNQHLALEEGTIEEWADTIAWFLTLLPEDSPTVCLLEAVFIPTPLPNTSSPEEVAAILNELNSRY